MIRITTETVVEFEILSGVSAFPVRLPLAGMNAFPPTGDLEYGTVVAVPFGMMTVSPATAAELLVALQRDKPEQDEGEAYCYDGGGKA